MIGVVFAIVFLSNQATEQATQEIGNQKFSFQVFDRSKLIKPELLKEFGGSSVTSAAASIEAVKQGRLDAFFAYPEDISTEPVKVYANDVGIFNNGRYEGVARSLLQQSVTADVSANIMTVLSDKITTSTITYKDSQVYNGITEAIVPGLFLVLFYILISTFGNRMLTSTVEEKENRVIEMILTTISARTLIIGKILALVTLGFLQVLVTVAFIVIGYLSVRHQLQLPDVDLSRLAFDPVRIGSGFVLFSLSFLLFTGLLVAIGAASPTAKDAGGFFGVIMILIFGPLYALSVFISTPQAPIVQFLSYFPLTAPIPLLLRNAVGNLQPHEFVIASLIMAVTAGLTLMIAIHIFRYGALEYNRKVSLKEMLTRRA